MQQTRSSRFRAVGLTSLAHEINGMLEVGTPLARGDAGGRTLRWTDGEVECWLHLDTRCAVPGYSRGVVRQVRVVGWHEDTDGCPTCGAIGVDLLSDDGAPVPLMLALASGRKPTGSLERVAIAGLVESAESWSSVDAYRAAGNRLLGLYPLGPYAAMERHRSLGPRALVAGATVRSVEYARNGHSGQAYRVVRVRTYGFDELPLLFAHDVKPNIVTGNAVFAQVWMYGHPVA